MPQTSQVRTSSLLVALAHGAAEADGEARAGLGVRERRRERILVGQRDRGLQPIGAVVAHEDAHRGVGDPALQVRAQQLVALLLVLGHLHALGEARLRVRVLGVAGGLRFGCGAPRAAVRRER